MSQQGEKPAAHEDDWWRKLYDESAPDTGPSRAADSLDDRFDSVSDTVSGPADTRRASARETVRDPYADAYEDPFADRYESPDADGYEAAHPAAEPVRDVDANRPPDQGRLPGQSRSEAPPPPPVVIPDPSVATGPVQDPGPDRAAAPSPDPDPSGVADPPPVPAAAPAPDPVPDPRVLAPPPPTAPRTTAFPAPWEAPGGQAGPRTFAAPRVPAPPVPEADGQPEAGLAADPSALHELPPDPTLAAGVRPVVGHLGDRPPTYDAEPAALPSATSENLEGLVPDTVSDGASYGTYTLRAASVRGDSARFRGEPRRDGLLTARFGAAESALVLVAVAGGRRDGEAAHLAAADACRWIGGAVARSHLRLSEDIRAGRRGDLKSGLHRLTDRTYGKLRARAAELGVEPDAYTANLRCLLLSADPDCRTRVFFGVGSGGLFRLRDGLWQDLEPFIPESGGAGPAAWPGGEQEAGPDGDRLTMDLQITGPATPDVEGPPQPPAEPFRFRASVARPGDTLMLCSNGLAEPMRGEPALPGELAERWGSAGPPGLPAFLADTQLRIKGYADDRTCAAVWEA
ncbi:protein phosphatase 2C domain-containing protein [Streptomyces sp. WA6-1-16]|uniref:protein phosphatase 2C domain-containing protein n=1 Tax=Streptomyces sp. WA6-1-16 TaxID=2879427 RepID=UPI001CE33702|nr:protein phosphatase 2C domain-containing protein [Streptomyces sp. WA6-1-16]UCA52137.1 protein phosphatase 2C domain-containing protein [Streptomyces sp. WA6-1-16]